VALHSHLGIDRVVIVHPSPYGADNRCSVDAIQRIGLHRARGVAVIGPDTTDGDMQFLNAAGMRGTRVNLETAGVFDPAEAWAALLAAARRAEPMDWHVQVFARLAVVAALADELATLPVTLVIDHFGRPDAALGVDQSGFDALRRLVASGQAYVKLSAAYRISGLPDLSDVAPLARALIAENPDRMLWGTDWPHPGGTRRAPDASATPEPFQIVDDGQALDRVAAWAPDPTIRQKILVENPARLYRF
jgi:predicted TIM-barrel fold metal-dependent hydrolase